MGFVGVWFFLVFLVLFLVSKDGFRAVVGLTRMIVRCVCDLAQVSPIGTVKHIVCVRCLAHVPVSDRLVERGGATKHEPHRGHLAYIPTMQGLVKRGGAVEHVVHCGDVAHVPVIQRLVELIDVHEHAMHRGHVARVPVRQRTIERRRAVEQGSHARHVTRIPVLDRAVDKLRRRFVGVPQMDRLAQRVVVEPNVPDKRFDETT